MELTVTVNGGSSKYGGSSGERKQPTRLTLFSLVTLTGVPSDDPVGLVKVKCASCPGVSEATVCVASTVAPDFSCEAKAVVTGRLPTFVTPQIGCGMVMVAWLSPLMPLQY